MDEMESRQALNEFLSFSEEPAVLEKAETPAVDDDEIIELGDSWNLGQFEVVRREFFAHLRDPGITFTDSKFSVNKACLNKFPETDYVQVLVNRDTKILALRPCSENARDSYAWCRYKNGKRESRQVTCRLFYAKIAALMNWSYDYRYKLLGHVVHANGEYLLVFDLNAPEAFEKRKGVASRTPLYPEDWQHQFGIPFNEHQQSMQINIFDGYAIFAVKEKNAAPSTDTAPEEAPLIIEGEMENE